MTIKRGEIYLADLSPVVGSEQGGQRPVLIVQNDMGNKYSPTVIIVAITAQITKSKLPTHVELPAKENGLNRDSVILCEQLRTIDKKRLLQLIGTLDQSYMDQVNQALTVSLELVDFIGSLSNSVGGE